MSKERKTLQQMAEETRDQDKKTGIGLSCPQCGCRDTRVVKTWHDAGGVETSRRRVCRHCGHRLVTMEIVT